MSKRRVFNWTPLHIGRLNKVLEVIEDLKAYKPLTLRQVYYQLVGKGYLENKPSRYVDLSKLVKQARIDGYIAWEDIEDRARPYYDLTGWDGVGMFVEAYTKHFLTGYKRDLLRSQDVYIEVWIEKDALSSIATRISSYYTIPVVVGRGFSSVSFLNDYRDRLRETDKTPILLYFGDLDPSGVEAYEAMITTLTEELKVAGIRFKRVALLMEDVVKYQLIHNPKAIKKTDKRAPKYIREYGLIAVELDALRPEILEGKIREAIEGELNMDLLNRELQEHNKELDKLNRMRDRVTPVIENIWGEIG